jgi:hypothetical protein
MRNVFIITLATPMLALAQSACPPLGPGQIGLGQYCQVTPAVPANSTVVSAAANAAVPTPPNSAVISQPVASTSAPHQPKAPGAPGELVPPVVNTKTWRIEPTDGRLANSFDRWARADGMRLVWDARQHIAISAGDSFEGTLQDALKRVLSSPAIRNTYPLEVCFYPNNPPVMRVTELGEQKGCTQ